MSGPLSRRGRPCAGSRSRPARSRSSTTAMAEARPTCRKLKAVCRVWMTNVADAVGAAGHDERDLEDAEAAGDGEDEGQADDAADAGEDEWPRTAATSVAPSSSAASYSSRGIDWIAPRNSTKLSPVYRHTEVPASDQLTTSGSPSHCCWDSESPSNDSTRVERAARLEEVEEDEADRDAVDQVREEQDAVEEVREPGVEAQDRGEVQRDRDLHERGQEVVQADAEDAEDARVR